MKIIFRIIQSINQEVPNKLKKSHEYNHVMSIKLCKINSQDSIFRGAQPHSTVLCNINTERPTTVLSESEKHKRNSTFDNK